ncbi:MAG TPA: alpha/beta fold hydrolase [Candidatus Elarobacter sp.]|jgi:dienelactone hydrolase|nr:alpha/beta fold hydrolase [Candidatus Elarobacter sp.]
MIAALALSALLGAATPQPHPGEPIRREVHENSLVGEFVVPHDAARQPAVILLGGLECGVPGDAFTFARRGYAAFAVAYCGTQPLPRTADETPVETVSRAVDWLVANPEVDPKRIAIVGISQGSALALLAAARDPRIKTVAVVSPTAYVWFSPAFDGQHDRSSWSENAGGLPFIPPDANQESALGRAFDAGGTYAFRDLYDASLAAAKPALVAQATIPVERIRAPLLCVAGADDREWDSAGACKTIAARRLAAHEDAADRVVIEPRAGHFLALSGRPQGDVMPAGKMKIRLGGDLQANTQGQGDALAAIQTFFAKTL